jgi:short-subunit dehydrogenase
MARPVVLITGASSGIGAACVPVFARAGFDVALTARRTEKLRALSERHAAAFPQATLLPLACDVTSDDSVRATMAVLKERWGRLDALVNNAGYGVYGSLEETALETVRANFETNVFGVLRVTQAALPLLRAAVQASPKRWGAAVVNVSSFVGRRAVPNLSSYSATKFALEAFSEAFRLEVWDERIAVSVVNPGATQTEFFDAAEGTRPKGFAQPRMTAETVAGHILRATKKPIRNIYLTAEGRAGLLAQWLAPSLMDAVLLRKVWRKRKG